MTEKSACNDYAHVYAAVEGVPLLNSCHEKDEAGTVHATPPSNSPLVYPAFRRISAGTAAISPPGPPNDHVLIRTAGNALQAVPRSYYERTIRKKNVLGVPVPPNSRGGDHLVVRDPHNPRKVVQVAVPPNSAPGQMFFCEMPIRDAPAAGVASERPSHELELSTDPDPTNAASAVAGATITATTPEFVLVQVPEGQTPGSRLQVSLVDGRTLVAVVPSDPTIREFYLKVPDKV